MTDVNLGIDTGSGRLSRKTVPAGRAGPTGWMTDPGRSVSRSHQATDCVATIPSGTGWVAASRPRRRRSRTGSRHPSRGSRKGRRRAVAGSHQPHRGRRRYLSRWWNSTCLLLTRRRPRHLPASNGRSPYAVSAASARACTCATDDGTMRSRSDLGGLRLATGGFQGGTAAAAYTDRLTTHRRPFCTPRG